MSESRGSVRMNISVAAQLKQRMDEASDRVNWSAVAAEAFERKLLELRATASGATKMLEVIERMRAAEELDSNEQYRAGQAGGERWAKNVARPRELRRLIKAVQDSDGHGHGDSGDFVSQCNDSHRGIGAELSKAMLGEKGDQLVEFWQGILGEKGDIDIEDDDFSRGFIDGALEVWEAVRVKL